MLDRIPVSYILVLEDHRNVADMVKQQLRFVGFSQDRELIMNKQLCAERSGKTST